MTSSRLIACALAAVILPAADMPDPTERRICDNQTGMHRGHFFTFWKSGGDACMTLAQQGSYTADYRLAARENLVAGKGWRLGSQTRTIGYKVDRFEAGSNSYLTLYGWSVDPLIEYYVVEDWGSNFTPPGDGAKRLGTLRSDGGVYAIYRTQRVQQPSIRGTQTFHQYWSVRTQRQTFGKKRKITFANHVAAWRKVGMRLGRMDYQVLATEGFGSTGNSAVTLWQE